MNRTGPGLRVLLHAFTLVAGWCFGGIPSAMAHLMPSQRGTLHVVDTSVFAAISLPCSAIRGVDDDEDRRCSSVELRAHEPWIHDELLRRIRIVDSDHRGRVAFVQLNAEADDRDPASSAGSMHFLVLMKVDFARAPAALGIEADFFGRAADEQQLTIEATRGAEAETVVLSPRRPTHSFFRAAARSTVSDAGSRRSDVSLVCSALAAAVGAFSIVARSSRRGSAAPSDRLPGRSRR